MKYIGCIHNSRTDQIGQFVRVLTENDIDVTVKPAPDRYLQFFIPSSVSVESGRHFHNILNELNGGVL